MKAAQIRTLRIRPTDHPDDATTTFGRATMCGLKGMIETALREYSGGNAELSDTIGEYRYEITDYDPVVDCKRCLAAMKRAKIGAS